MGVEKATAYTSNHENETEQFEGVVECENQEHHVHREMLPPPPKMFISREDLLQYVHKYSFSQGYATSIRDSKKDKYVRIGCDRGGAYRHRSNTAAKEQQMRTSSRLIDCPFEIRGNKQDDGMWELRVKDGSHNHEPSKDMSGHPSFRRLSHYEFLRVKEMTASGIPPRQMITSLRNANPDILAVSRTIYTAKAKIRKDELGGRTPIQALLEDLSEKGFMHNIKCDAEDCLTHLFFSHPFSVTLSKSYSNIFVMDCTYKSNKFKMPLLNIIGVTSFNTSFYSSCVFLRKEEEGDYIWALNMFKEMLGDTCQSLVIVTDRELALMNAIQVVFPTSTHLLCVWHIEKNILANCRPLFGEDQDWADFLSLWTKVIQSPTESLYLDAWKEFEDVYAHQVVAINYIRSTWLPLRKRFVKAWTDKHLHFGNHVTSRAEGAHATLKKYLQVSTGDLRVATRKISLAIENNFREIKIQLASEKIRIPHFIFVPFFKELFRCVSVFALDKLLKQYKSVSSGATLPPCTGHFFASMGLPCAHMMRSMNNELRLTYIHPQWRIDERSFELMPHNQENQLKALFQDLESKYEQWPISQREAAEKQLFQLINSPTPIVFDPIVQPHKGRPLGAKRKKAVNSSTIRDPSAFEFVERSRKCSICKVVGHNSRTCPQANSNSNVVMLNLAESGSSSHGVDLNSLPGDIGCFI